jgi:hypothetical protein
MQVTEECEETKCRITLFREAFNSAMQIATGVFTPYLCQPAELRLMPAVEFHYDNDSESNFPHRPRRSFVASDFNSAMRVLLCGSVCRSKDDEHQNC